jgi:hypothetical protein
MSEYRDLSLSEWNFHKILEKHLLELLDKQRTYWKKGALLNGFNWVMLEQSFFMLMPL